MLFVGMLFLTNIFESHSLLYLGKLAWFFFNNPIDIDMNFIHFLLGYFIQKFLVCLLYNYFNKFYLFFFCFRRFGLHGIHKDTILLIFHLI